MKLTRRKLLGLSGSLGVAALAGCSSPGGEGTQEAPPREVAWPEVSSKKLSKWTETNRRKSSRTDSKYYLDVHSYQRTIIYDYSALRNEVRKKTNGQFDSPLAMFFATHIDLQGTGTIGATTTEIMNGAVSEFKSEMERSGVKNPTLVETQLTQPDIEGSLTREFAGYYPTPKIETEIPLGDGLGTRILKIGGTQLPISGFITVWKDGRGTAFVAGGAYPAADFEEESTISVTSTKGDGIDATVAVDLNLKPSEIRSTIIDLVESVTKSDEKA